MWTAKAFATVGFVVGSGLQAFDALRGTWFETVAMTEVPATSEPAPSEAAIVARKRRFDLAPLRRRLRDLSERISERATLLGGRMAQSKAGVAAGRAAEQWRARVQPHLHRFAQREDLQFILHAALVLFVLTLYRPSFASAVPDDAYRGGFAHWELLVRDFDILRGAARAQRPASTRLFFVFIPALLLWLGRQRITWDHWEAGKALRGLVMTLVVIMAWAGSTYGYNTYVNQGHFLDRALLLALAAWCWRSPMAVPFFTTSLVVMMRETSFPIGHDDFDWRPQTELLMLFSCFVWLSFLKTLKSAHFVFLAVLLLGSYYYEAGVAKWGFGPEQSWIWENRVTNISVSAHLRGWMGFLSHETWLAFVGFARWFDVPQALFTIVLAELGAIVFINAHPKLTRMWLLCAALMHIGIFVLTGICFWKWVTADLAMWWFLKRGGAEVHRQVFRHKLVLVFGAVLLFFAAERVWFNPQTNVVWYDTRLNEVYNLFAVGPSGTKYRVDYRSMAPHDARLIQEDFCVVTDEPRFTGIYGTSWNYQATMELERATSLEQVRKIVQRHARRCNNKARAQWMEYFTTFFKNLNRYGWQHQWLGVIGRPNHLWVRPAGEPYEGQEPVAYLEMWRERIFYDGDAVHSLGDEQLFRVRIDGP